MKQFFEQAYTTGSDMWTHMEYMPTLMSMIREVPTGSMILDVGAGRGKLAMRLADMGYKVIGLEYVKQMVDKSNAEAKERNMADQVRFLEGDVLAIAFVDEGFDIVTDVGLLQHMANTDWEKYVSEVARVLKTDGLYINVSLSRETPAFMDWQPAQSATGTFEKYGLTYHFFTNDEMRDLFEDQFEVVEQRTQTLHGHAHPDTVLLFSKFRKK
jgi:ubiquinone/menaquinone biosynthesis C-methylase UbiE